MDSLAWAPLFRLCVGELRMRPADFWSLTLPELAWLLARPDARPPDREWLADALARFPDRGEDDGSR